MNTNPKILENQNTPKPPFPCVFDKNNVKGVGRLEIDKGSAIRVRVSNDFINYYLWLVKRRFYGITGATLVNNDRYFTPRNGAHISVILPKFHVWKKEWNDFKWNGPISFYYNPENLKFGGSQQKGFSNFWLPVVSPDIDEIKNVLLGKDRVKKNTLGMHLTICNSKNDRTRNA